MKLTIKQSELNDALAVCGRAISPKPLIPILEYYRLQITPQNALITGGNLEVFISKTISCQSETEMDIALPAQRLAGLIAALPEQELEFNVDDKAVEIRAKSGKYLIPFESGENYPVMNIQDARYFNADIAFAAEKTLWAASSKSETSFFGVSCEIKKGSVVFTACDRCNLSSLEIPCDADFECTVLLHPETMRALLPGIGKIGITDKNITVEYADVLIKSVLIDMVYPDWHAIIPANEKTVTVSQFDLYSSLRRTVQFSNELDKTVLMIVEGSEMSLKSANLMSESADERLQVASELDMKISLNGSMFLECISKLKGDTAVIKFTNERTALTIQEGNHFMLTMPQVAVAAN